MALDNTTAAPPARPGRANRRAPTEGEDPDMNPRLLHITDDGDPITQRDHAVDILANLGWPTDDVTQASADQIATRHAGYPDGPEAGYWMATLPPAIEGHIADAEAHDVHYWAAIWTQTWGTTIAKVEAVTTW